MAKQRLQVDPMAIDLMQTAIVLTRREKLQHAGHYAFLALGRVMAKNLHEEEGVTTPTNFSRRLELLCEVKGFPEEWRKKIYTLWNRVRYYLYKKVSYIPSYRSLQIKNFVQFVTYILEQLAGVKFEELISTITDEDMKRLQDDFGDTLFPEEDYEAEI